MAMSTYIQTSTDYIRPVNVHIPYKMDKFNMSSEKGKRIRIIDDLMFSFHNHLKNDLDR